MQRSVCDHWLRARGTSPNFWGAYSDEIKNIPAISTFSDITKTAFLGSKRCITSLLRLWPGWQEGAGSAPSPRDDFNWASAAFTCGSLCKASIRLIYLEIVEAWPADFRASARMDKPRWTCASSWNAALSSQIWLNLPPLAVCLLDIFHNPKNLIKILSNKNITLKLHLLKTS